MLRPTCRGGQTRRMRSSRFGSPAGRYDIVREANACSVRTPVRTMLGAVRPIGPATVHGMAWTERVTVTLPGEAAEGLRKIAAAAGRSVSALVAEAVAERHARQPQVQQVPLRSGSSGGFDR